MNKLKNIIYLLGLSIVMIFTGCSDIDDEITNIDYDRLFSPTELSARVVNRTNVRLTWEAVISDVKNVESYTVEVFQNGDLNFEGTPLRTITGIKSSPYTIEKLDGDVSYSIRVQAVGSTTPSSKWVSAVVKTDTEQIFYPIDEENDLKATEVTLRWQAGEPVTELILTPGDVTYTLTDQQKADGVLTITGLTGETAYTATLKNGAKIRGILDFTTIIDLGGATAVYPESDFTAMLAAATDNTVFALFPGTYTVTDGKVSITKNIAIKAAKPTDRPVLKAIISLEAGVSFELKDVIMDGAEAVDAGKNADQAIQFNTASVSYGDITINGCEIRNYLKGLLYFNVSAIAESVTINNCIIYDVECNGGDFFDCRLGTPKQINFTNNTVYNSIKARDMFRIDNAGLSATPKLLVDHNTIYNVVNDAGRRIFYVRWTGNEITFTNNIIAGSIGTLKHSSSNVNANKNNYFNAATIAGADNSGTTYDPQFKNAAEGDFTVQNLDVYVGDPRWLD